MSREDVLDFLDDYAAGEKQAWSKDGLGGGLITSYLIEYHTHGKPKGIKPTLVSDEWSLKSIEGGAMYYVTDKGKPLGFAESVSDRYLLIHSAQETQEADGAVKRRVKESSNLDLAWLSGSFLEKLWREWVLPYNPGRTAQLKFDHQSYFDYDVDIWGSDDERTEPHRHLASSSVSEIKETGERLGDILTKLQEVHKPFNAIQMIRVPSFEARGSYDLWGWGKLTHRSDDFRRGRSYLTTFATFYDRVVAAVEERMSFYAEISGEGAGYTIHGAPMTVRFDPPLETEVFRRLVISTFVNGNGPLRLWGNPIWVGPRRVHVYGIDRHLWQKVYMELTPNGMTVVLPRGTCGNTVNRLLANLQRYVSPGVQAWIGDQAYSDLVSSCLLPPPDSAPPPPAE